MKCFDRNFFNLFIPVKPTFFLQFKHRFFFFFPLASFPSFSSGLGEAGLVESSPTTLATAIPSSSDSFLCKKTKMNVSFSLWCSLTILMLVVWKWNQLRIFWHILFPHIVSAATLLFWIYSSWKFNSFRILSNENLNCFLTSAETIRGILESLWGNWKSS